MLTLANLIFQVDDSTGNNVIVLNNVNVVAGQTKMIRIKNVKLGLEGGQTIWTLGTYDGALVGAQPRDASDIRDEAVNIQGFVMPGALRLKLLDVLEFLVVLLARFD